VTSHYFSDCSSDQGTFKKAKRQSGSKCSSDNSTLKTSFVSRILTPTGVRSFGLRPPWLGETLAAIPVKSAATVTKIKPQQFNKIPCSGFRRPGTDDGSSSRRIASLAVSGWLASCFWLVIQFWLVFAFWFWLFICFGCARWFWRHICSAT